jgi:RNA polymerase sigma-70 factor (ECF subfamily)
VSRATIEALFRHEAGRVLATLIRLAGEFELAQDALQDAFTAALEEWPAQGVPENPRAWLVRVGWNKAIDRVRRRVLERERQDGLEIHSEIRSREPAPEAEIFGDDLLRLIFTCCHPALDIETQVALTLHAVCGLSTESVARAFLVKEEAMAQRLVRAKRKIRLAGIPYETPGPALLEERLDGVLAVIYLVFTEGYAGTSGPSLTRDELAEAAIELGRQLAELLPGRAAIMGLIALMLLQHARRGARTTPGGDIVLLEQQDRTLWDPKGISEGLVLVERALGIPGRVSAYTVQAAIAALHARAHDYRMTDWRQIAGLYDVLLRIQPSPVVELNHAVAVAMVDGPARALDLLDSLGARGELAGYHLLPAARADLLERLGRHEEAREAYRAAIALVRLEPERRLLQERLERLEQSA